MTSLACIWPSPLVTGWSGAPGEQPPLLDVLDLQTALQTRWTTDAHVSGVLVPLAEGGGYEPKMPRLRKTSRKALAKAGQNPLLTLVFVDFDRQPHEPWPDGLQGQQARTAMQLACALCPEAAAYSTRAGLRMIWVLAHPVPVAQADSWLMAWLDHLDSTGLPGMLGLMLDKTSAQWTRGFRLPRVVRDGVALDPVLDVSALQVGLRLAWQPSQPLSSKPAQAPGVIDLGGEAVEAPGEDELPPLDEIDWSLVSSTEGVAGLAAHLRAGTPFAHPGSRDTTLVAGLGATVRALLHRVAPPAPPSDDHEVRRAALDLAERAYAVWHRAVDAAATVEDGAPTLGKLWRLAIEFSLRDVSELAKHLARHEQSQQSQPLQQSQSQNQDPDRAQGSGTEQLQGQQEPADQQGPAVVVVGSHFAVLNRVNSEHGYGPLIPAVALSAELRRKAPGIPALNARGTPLSAAQIVAHHGDVAIGVVHTYATPATTTATTSIARSWFDEDTRVLHRVCAPLRPVTPTYDPEVAAWLAALCAGHASAPVELLLDWLATASQLDRATSALYLRGAPNAGKTLFATGLAALWAEAPVSFTSAISNFNAELLSCPVVHLSEGIDRYSRVAQEGVAEGFKALVGDRTHTVEQKYEVKSTLLGYPRVVVAANHDSALPMGSGHHTRDSLAAIAKRVLYVQAGSEAAAVLARVDPGRLAIWATPGGVIPAHLAWLRVSRGAEAHARVGSRFLVAGIESEWHRALLLRSGGNESVLATLVAAVVPRASSEPSIAVSVEPNKDPNQAKVWVNVARLHDVWKGLLLEDSPKPARALLARTIRDLSPSDRSVVRRFGSRGAQLRCWDIPGDLLIRVAEAHGVPEVDALNRVLRGMPAADNVIPIPRPDTTGAVRSGGNK